MPDDRKSRLIGLAISVTLGLGASEALAQTPAAGVLVVVGAGYTGNWNTEFEIANSTGSRLDLQLNTTPKIASLCPIGGCPGSAVIAISPRGSAKVHATDVHGIGTPLTFLGSLYLVSEANAAEESVVRARVFNIAAPTQSIEIPVFRLSTILSLNPSVLAFPSATRSESAHSNLVLAEVSNTGTLSMLVEAFSASGQLVGSLPVAITADPLDVDHRAVFLVDALSQLGVSQLEVGQIRVTKTGGDGVMWGLLATVYSDGRVIVSVGKNP